MISKKMRLKITIAAAVAVTTLMAPISGVIAEATTLKAHSNVNVRSSSNNSAAKVSYATAGTLAEYLGTENDWYKIRINGTVGFSHKNYWKGDTVTASKNVNIRAGSNNAASKVAYAVAGTEASLLGRNDVWIFINLNGTLGFSHKNYWDLSDTLFNTLPVVSSTVPAPAPAPAPPVKIEAGEGYELHVDVNGYQTASDAAARANPSNIRPAGEYYIYKEFSGMLNVSQYKGSAGAWINPAENTKTPDTQAPDNAQIIIEAAYSLLGAPYRLGGENWSDGGFDCSGLTRYAYRAAGISIPRASYQQWDGIKEKVTDPLPGDIIVFAKSGKVYHVGIYLGDNKMIHSPEPGKTVEVRDLSWHYKEGRVRGFLRPTK